MNNRRFEEEKKAFAGFIRDEKNRKTILMIITAAVLIAGISIGKNAVSGMKYITSDDGSVNGVVRDDAGKEAAYPLRIEADIDGKRKHKDVTLILKPDGKKKDSRDEKERKKDASAMFDAEVAALLSRLSKAGGKKIMLPGELSDGTKIRWHKSQGLAGVLVIFLAPVFIVLLYISNEKKKRDIIKEKIVCVQRELPAFNDELLLLLGSGLIFREAFRRIAEGRRIKKKLSYFDERILEIENETESGVSDMVNVLSRKADEMQVTEFSRLAGLIRDNQIRGLDIMSKLRMESEILWDLRKKNAEERGRLAETKLTVPLAILLMVLVLVTASPAIIQI